MNLPAPEHDRYYPECLCAFCREVREKSIEKGGDADLTDEQRGPFYEAWTEWRDYWERIGETADICDFRAGFQYGWDAALAVPTGDTKLEERNEA